MCATIRSRAARATFVTDEVRLHANALPPFHTGKRLLRGGLVFKAHRLVYHSTLGLRVIKKREEETPSLHAASCAFPAEPHPASDFNQPLKTWTLQLGLAEIGWKTVEFPQTLAARTTHRVLI